MVQVEALEGESIEESPKKEDSPMPMMNMIQSDSSLGKMEQSYLNELNKALY